MSEALRAAVLDDYQHVCARFADWAPIAREVQVQVFHDHVADEDLLVERLAPFAIVFLMRERTRLPAGVLARLPRLRLIVTGGMWNAAVDLQAAHAQGIAVRGTLSPQTGAPELTWALLLALARHLPQELASVRQGGWQTAVGMDLHGRTLGIVGLGIIGRQVARVAGAFGMQVLAWSPNLTPQRAHDAGASRVELAELLARADFVTVHMKLTATTRGLIGARELAQMKPGAYIINTSRGPLVDEAALVQALRDGRIAGAGLDTFDVEPLPPAHPLRQLQNVLATPHVGYVTEGTYRSFFAQMVEDVRAWIDGVPVRVIAADSNP